MAKLSKDEITWVLSVNSTAAQQEVHKLAERNRELAEHKSYVIKKMKQLEKQGQQNSKEYKELASEVDYLNTNMRENKTRMGELVDEMDKSSLSMNQLRSRAAELQKQLDATSRANDPRTWDAMKSQLDAYKKQMGAVKTSGASLMQQMSGMPGIVGTAARSIQGFGTALKALAANPVGVVIMALIVALKLVKTAIEGSDSGRTKLAAWFKAIRVVIDSCVRALTEWWALLYNIVSFQWGKALDNVKNIADLGSSLAANAEAAYEAEIAQDALNDELARYSDLTQVNKARIEQLREITRDSTKSIEDRKQASKELFALEDENYKMAVAGTIKQYDIYKNANKNLILAMKRSSDKQFKEVEKYMSLVHQGTELTIRQRRRLAELVNDITSNLDEGTEEQKEKFRSFFNDLAVQQAEFYKGRRKDVIAAINTEEEAQRNRAQKAKEAAEAAKNAIKKRVDAEGALLEEAVIAEKKRLQEGVISKEKYEQKIIELTIASVRKQLQIKGIEAATRRQLEARLIDMELKGQDDAKKQLEKQDKAKLDEVKKFYDKMIKEVELSGESLIIATRMRQEKGLINEQQASQEIQAIELETSRQRLEIQEKMYDEILGLTLNTEDERSRIILALDANILASQRQLTEKRISLAKDLSAFENGTRSKFGVTTLQDEEQQKLQILEAAYQARLALARKYHQDEGEVHAAYLSAKEQLERDSQIRTIETRRQVGIASISDQLEAELLKLKEMHQKGLLSEVEYQEARRMHMMQTSEAMYTQMVNNVSAMFTSLQDAELARIEMRYDAEIEAAEGNEEKIDEINERREASKLEIQKKYADVQFAIRVAEIVADTAVSAMKAYAQLGPIAGPVAAGLIAVTGAAQVAIANAEREKIKNMNPKFSSSNSAAVRVASGREEGGYIDVEREQDGKRYHAAFQPRRRGYVDRPTVIVADGPAGHSREWVASNEALSNPSVAGIIAELDIAQRMGTIRTIDAHAILSDRVYGHESGGYIDSAAQISYSQSVALPSASNQSQGSIDVLKRLISLLERLERDGLPSVIVLSELEKKQQLLNRSKDLARK